jgi:hypothetical protein
MSRPSGYEKSAAGAPSSDATPPPDSSAGADPHLARFPSVIYVLCEPVREGDTKMTLELRTTRDGRSALLVYSSLERLVSCCGPYQPWTQVLSASLDRVREQTGFNLVLLDLVIPEEHRRVAEVVR